MKIQPRLVLSILLLLCLAATAPQSQAVVPTPDGSYPGANTAEGQNALLGLTTGRYNTAVGYLSLRTDSTGGFNTAIGAGSLLANTGNENTGTGAGALLSNTTGTGNTASGAFALFSNSIGPENTAIGSHALFSNMIGNGNTANGFQALFSNMTGGLNTANGLNALFSNTTGDDNTAIGYIALAYSTGYGNTALGAGAGTSVITANNVICIGAAGREVDNSCYIANIRDVTTANADAIPVVIDSTAQLGTVSSSKRFKKEIKPMDKASDSILGLKPVTFHYKSDKTSTPQFGLIAEEVAEVNPDLVVRDKNGEIYTVRYDAVNAMLLNEFLKEHREFLNQQRKVEKQDGKLESQARKIQEQQATITELKKDFQFTVAKQQKQMEALTAGLQKVSTQLEMSKPAPQTVGNY